MKKFLIPVLVVVLTACNTNNGGGNGTQKVGSYPSDTPRVANPSDSTPASNSDAYNTTDTGLSKGTGMDSSGRHSAGSTTRKKQ